MVSPEIALASNTVRLIDSIIVGDDIVPRLSFASLSHLKQIIMSLLGQSNNMFQRAFHWMSSGMGDGVITNKVAGLLKVREI